MDDDLIFARALEITDPVERKAFVSAQCRHDSARSDFINGLIDSHFDAEGFMSEPAANLRENKSKPDLSSEPSVPLGEKPGDWIGPFELLDEIGRGGMAVVYRARQSSPITREVALKIVKPGLETEQVIARMEIERQTLALMNHPNIAAVYDAGLSPLGRPYFAMELVDGVSITHYCQNHKLNQRQRVELLVKVCDAVQHAHSRGIIHRDLKPSNILVNNDSLDGLPKVIDFGIAKVLAAESGNDHTLTTQGQIVGTPQYMSPEQAVYGAGDIDTRSDIYSLGAVLYELLSGKPPFESDSLSGVLDQVAGKEPVPPAKLNRTVSPDLETICLCCLRKDPEKRYATVQALAEDLNRFLDGHPVWARTAGVMERLGKWARRSPAAATLGFVCVVGIIAFVSLWAIFTLQLKDQRDTIQSSAELLKAERNFANENFLQAHKAIRKYLDTVQSHTPLGSSRDLIYQQELIQSGLEFYEQLLARKDDKNFSLASEQKLREIQLEQINLNMEYGKVLAVAEDLTGSIEVFNNAIDMLNKIRSPSTDPDKIDIKLGSTYISIARTYLQDEQLENAKHASQQAVRVLERIDGNGPSAQYCTWLLAIAWQRMGSVQLAMNQPDEAFQSFSNALRHSNQLSAIFDFQLTHTESCLLLGQYYRQTGSIEDADEWSSKALKIIESVCVRCVPTLPRYDQKRVECLVELAKCQIAQGEQGGANETLAKAIELKSRLVAENPGTEQLLLELASLHEVSADWSDNSAQREQARAEAQRIVQQIESTSNSPGELQVQARMFLRASTRHHNRGETELEVRRLKAAMDLVDRIPPDYQPQNVNSMKTGIRYQLAHANVALTDFDTALDYFLAFRQQVGSLHLEDRAVYALCLAETGQHQQAIQEIDFIDAKIADKNDGEFAHSAYLPLVRLHAILDSTANTEPAIRDLLIHVQASFVDAHSADEQSCLYQAFALCRMIELLNEMPEGRNSYATFIAWAESLAIDCVENTHPGNVNFHWGILRDRRIAVLQHLPAFQQLHGKLKPGE